MGPVIPQTVFIVLYIGRTVREEGGVENVAGSEVKEGHSYSKAIKAIEQINYSTFIASMFPWCTIIPHCHLTFSLIQQSASH